jgi:poly(A) polymerase
VKIRFHVNDERLVRAAKAVAAELERAGHAVLFAGGCVRDALLGRRVKDIDIATSATPDQVEALFEGHTVAVGKSFGVVLVRRDGFSFDVATLRTDSAYADGRHPDRVEFATPEGDAQRRDFTINGLFCEPADDAVIDFVGGLADLEGRVIRAVGDPGARFREDHLRMLRAVRFASVLGFTLDPATRAAVAAHAEWIGKVSAERIAAEITRMLCEAPRPSLALNLLRETGLLKHTLPEVEALSGVAQPPQFHPEGDVWTHTCLMLDEVAAPRDPVLAWSLLLHDIGKPATFCEEPDEGAGESRIRFPCHAPVGAELAERILMKLKQPTALVEKVKAVVGGHMQFVEAEKMRRAKLRRFMGTETFPVLLDVMRADIQHSNRDFTSWLFLKAAFEAFRSEPVLPEPLVRGRDLIAWGVAPGPELGKVLHDVYDAQLEGCVASCEEARAWVNRRLPLLRLPLLAEHGGL